MDATGRDGRTRPRRGAWAKGMPGGPQNPLGARALFQNGRDTLYRIHGTIEPRSIGKSMPSGCIRLLNQDVIDLYRRVPIGSRTVVLQSAAVSSSSAAPASPKHEGLRQRDTSGLAAATVLFPNGIAGSEIPGQRRPATLLCSKVSNKFGEMSQRRCIGAEPLIKPPSQCPRSNPLRSTVHTGRHDIHTRPPTRLGRNYGGVCLRMDKVGTCCRVRRADGAWKCGTVFLR